MGAEGEEGAVEEVEHRHRLRYRFPSAPSMDGGERGDGADPPAS